MRPKANRGTQYQQKDDAVGGGGDETADVYHAVSNYRSTPPPGLTSVSAGIINKAYNASESSLFTVSRKISDDEQQLASSYQQRYPAALQRQPGGSNPPSYVTESSQHHHPQQQPYQQHQQRQNSASPPSLSSYITASSKRRASSTASSLTTAAAARRRQSFFRRPIFIVPLVFVCIAVTVLAIVGIIYAVFAAQASLAKAKKTTTPATATSTAVVIKTTTTTKATALQQAVDNAKPTTAVAPVVDPNKPSRPTQSNSGGVLQTASIRCTISF